MHVRFYRAEWEFKRPFRIAYRIRTHAATVVVEVQEGSAVGRGEAAGVSYRGETIDTLLEQLAGVALDVQNGTSREHLEKLLPAGGARNALDCALWDLESKRSGRRAWELAGLEGVRQLLTAYTLGVDTPEITGQAAADAIGCTLLKIKLTGAHDIERVAAVRRARPDAQLIVDANQAWSEEQLREYTPQLAQLGVLLIEQPLPIGKDAVLRDFESPVPLCADESCQDSSSLPELLGKYQFVNIKLDKTGGLTEALRLAHAARMYGLKLMVGCMGGSSLAMAPAFVLGQLCEIVDLDGPLLMKFDVAYAIVYEGDRMSLPDARLWG